MAEVLPKPDKVLDCTGLSCPIPVMKTARAIKKMKKGQILQLISTDPGAVPDMEAWTKNTGHKMLNSYQENEKYVFYFRRK